VTRTAALSSNQASDAPDGRGNITIKKEGRVKDKICLVTGATDGIGKVTAMSLARMGATVVGVGRNAQKTAAVTQEIKQATGNQAIEFLVADLSQVRQVRQVATEFKRRYARLDVLVNNAGGYFARRQETAEGREMTWALNHLNYFVLTNELLDILKASAPSRIVNVSSDAHQGSSLNLNDVEFKQGYGQGWKPYAHSKLANVMFTYELARRLNGANVTANALHPGFVATKFGHNNGSLVSILMRSIQKLVALTPEKGAQTSIYLASAPAVEGVTGKYFSNSKVAASTKASYDTAAAARLWDLSLDMI